jgi:hypothetical protein
VIEKKRTSSYRKSKWVDEGIGLGAKLLLDQKLNITLHKGMFTELTTANPTLEVINKDQEVKHIMDVIWEMTFSLYGR